MKVGQLVKLVSYSSKLPDNYNPRDCNGKIVSLDGKMNPVIVEWENGFRNSYGEKDLQRVFIT